MPKRRASGTSRPKQSSAEPEAKRRAGVAGPGDPRSLSDARPNAAAPAGESATKPTGDPAAVLDELAQVVADCTRCGELAETRTQTVFGVGNPRARLVFCGEAPGADEDRQGEPFVGRAGQLLNKILAACGLRREDVYILNILRCRPPENRTPTPAEAANCREYLDGQLAVIQPEYICCLGTCAAQNLLDSKLSIGKMRGQFFEYRGARVLCTYHPSYLLRNPAAKRDVWEDMQLLMKEMGIEIPKH